MKTTHTFKPCVLALTCASLFSASLFGAAMAADLQWPNTPAAQVAKKRLQAFNAGDAKALEAYKQAHEPELQVQRELAFRQMTGGFEILRVTPVDPHQVTVILREQDGDRVGSLQLQVDAKAPARVSRVGVQPMASVPADLMPARLSEAELRSKTLAKAGKLLAADQFAGNFLVARAGQAQWLQSFGDAKREPTQKINAGTRFRMGSMYKMFTAVALLQLMEQGKLSLDDPLIKHVPDYPNPDLARQVRLRHLLTHTGGTGDIFTDEYQQQRMKTREHADYVRLFGARAGEFTPGSLESYSNYGYVLLGAVIERLSGQSYHAYVQDKIFKPAGMLATGAEPEDKVREQLSVGYMQTETGLADNRDTLPWRGTAAGGGYSSVGDLRKFAEALLAGKLLSEKNLAEATKAQTASGVYGFGFQIGGEGLTRHFGHVGGAEGMNGALRIYPASGDIVVALSNMDPPAAESLVEYYGNRMPLNKTPTGK